MKEGIVRIVLLLEYDLGDFFADEEWNPFDSSVSDWEEYLRDNDFSMDNLRVVGIKAGGVEKELV